MTPLRLGTRGSELARWQATTVAAEIRRQSGRDCELVVIATTGDRLTEVSLSTLGGKRVFVKEIEQALDRGDIDLAVHSAKDMPADLPDGLTIAAVLPREDPRDAVVLPAGATAPADLSFPKLVATQATAPRVGSGSVRRAAQLRRRLPTARFHLVRGNVGTRLRKLDDGGYDLLILAAAGLRRLGFTDRISAAIDVSTCVPAPGQGIIAIETRREDGDTLAALTAVNDTAASAALSAERALVRALGGGCQVPIGAFAETLDGRLHLRAIVASLDGSQMLRREASQPVELADALGEAVAAGLLEDGAGPILQAAQEDSAQQDETS
jgi:hydroxymethylbilane synthase